MGEGTPASSRSRGAGGDRYGNSVVPMRVRSHLSHSLSIESFDYAHQPLNVSPLVPAWFRAAVVTTQVAN
jgi:hypothetical protein